MPRKFLDKCQWLEKFSDPLKDDLAKLMIPFDAPEGHVFIREGDPISSFLIVESGTLSRTKRITSPDASVGASVVTDEPLEIDDIGSGKVSGFLHVVGRQCDEVAYATITAKKGGAKVWVVPGGHFHKLYESNPSYSAEVMNVLAHACRTATKMVRAIVKPTGHHKDDEVADANKKVLKVLCYDTTSWVKENFEPQIKSFNDNSKDLVVKMDYTQDRLNFKTARFAAGHDAVCLFVNDTADAEALWVLSMAGVKMIAMRCAGFDRVDVKIAKTFGMTIARVPAYR